MTVRANGEFTLFKAAYIDGKLVAREHYTIKEGSTIITFSKPFLKTLSEGKHNLTMSYSDGGEANTTFEITDEKYIPVGEIAAGVQNVAVAAETLGLTNSNPKTGDDILISVTMLIMSVTAIGAIELIKKKIK